MNSTEKKITEILVSLRESHGVLGLAAGFGQAADSLHAVLRLKEISLRSGLSFALTIGGCESLRDMYEAKNIGVNILIAPMIESAYALRKYLQACGKIFSDQAPGSFAAYCSIETDPGERALDEIFAIPEIGSLSGIILSGEGLWDKDQKTVLERLRMIREKKLNAVAVLSGRDITDEFLSGLKEIDAGFISGRVLFSSMARVGDRKEIMKASAMAEAFILKGPARTEDPRKTARLELLEKEIAMEI